MQIPLLCRTMPHASDVGRRGEEKMRRISCSMRGIYSFPLLKHCGTLNRHHVCKRKEHTRHLLVSQTHQQNQRYPQLMHQGARFTILSLKHMNFSLPPFLLLPIPEDQNPFTISHCRCLIPVIDNPSHSSPGILSKISMHEDTHTIYMHL